MRTVEVEEERCRERLQRLELVLHDEAGGEHEVHVYEGYWAPLTEGKVTLRDTIGFLFHTGLNGLRNGSRPFRRWLFGSYDCFASPIRVVLYLLVVLAVAASLVGINSAIALVSAARATVGNPPAWLSNDLFADLTTTFDAYLAALLPLVSCLLASVFAARRLQARTPARGRRTRLALGWLAFLALLPAVLATVLAAVALPFLFYGHARWPRLPQGEIWTVVFPARGVNGLNLAVELLLLALVAAAALLVLVDWTWRIASAVLRELRDAGQPRRERWLTLLMTPGFLLLAGVVVGETLGFSLLFLRLAQEGGDGNLLTAEMELANSTLGAALAGISWLALIAVSAQIRGFLIQYLGDVAAYVSSHRLDRFRELREEIRACVYRAARAVYRRQEPDGSSYARVVVVGHSLGSLVVYDALNRLINDDELAGAGSPRFLDAAARTAALVTFGSPLDKTAFLFALQGERTDQPREALAASTQPLIVDYAWRPPRWINLHSPWDPISGRLDFYDPAPVGCDGRPRAAHPKHVDNRVDPDALPLLVAAHTEYWRNPLLYEILYDEVTR